MAAFLTQPGLPFAGVLSAERVVPGRRTQTLTIATTLTDAELSSKADIAELYGFRWSAELDIRSIKQSPIPATS
jgi:IS4 transposase